MARTALIVPVPEAEPAVGGLRRRHDANARLGVPAHVTILFPFVPAERLDEDVLRETLAPFRAFNFTLASVERWPDVVYLRPEPPGPFVELTRAVWARWPEHPPYEGVHEQLVPHLTVVHRADSATLDHVARALRGATPIAARARELLLLEEEAGGRWATRLRLPLG